MQVDKEQAKALAQGYSSFQRYLEISGITLYFAFFAWSVVRLIMISGNGLMSGVAWAVPSALLVALLFSDLVSGLVHWAADNWGSPHWPVLGPGFIRPFRHHHVDPEELTRHDFVELNGNNCIVVLPTFFVGPLSLPADSSSPWELALAVFWLGVAFLIFATNQLHAWAHAPKPPTIVQWLQRSRIILNRDHHEVHHTLPHDGNYCITNGWMNLPLRWLRIFTAIEWVITGITGVKPVHRQIRERMSQGQESGQPALAASAR